MDDTSRHHTDENTQNGIHSCNDTECMTRDVPQADLHQIGYALGVLAEALENTPLKMTVFRDDTGLYVLLTTPVDENDVNSRSVVGAIYTPTLLGELRSRGYTTTYAEYVSGVN